MDYYYYVVICKKKSEKNEVTRYVKQLLYIHLSGLCMHVCIFGIQILSIAPIYCSKGPTAGAGEGPSQLGARNLSTAVCRRDSTAGVVLAASKLCIIRKLE